jgi:hypothetical protein
MHAHTRRMAWTIVAALAWLAGWQAGEALAAETDAAPPKAAAKSPAPAEKSPAKAKPQVDRKAADKPTPDESTPAPAKENEAAKGITDADSPQAARKADAGGGHEGEESASAEAAPVTGALSVINPIYILVLAGFVGFEVIGRVSPLLHTPLMSATNAISGISLVGSLVAAGNSDLGITSNVLGFVAVTAATINVVGGFMITDRMLRMFKQRGKDHHG